MKRYVIGYITRIKTNRTVFIPVLISMFIMGISCEKNVTESNPAIRLVKSDQSISGDTNAAIGNQLKFELEALADKYPLTNFLIRVSGDTVQTTFDTGMHVNQLNWHGSFTKGFSLKEKWEFIIRDRQGFSSTTQIWITSDTGSYFHPLIEYPEITLGAQLNPATGSLFSLSDSSLYQYDEASADPELQKIIDLVYYYYGEDKHVLTSPGANIEEEVFSTPINTWENRNTSRFLKASLQPSDYYNILHDSILIADYLEGEAKRKAKNLSANDIYYFKTSKEKLGVFWVEEISGMEDGIIKIRLKIQE